jgi:hypothetical protein
MRFVLIAGHDERAGARVEGAYLDPPGRRVARRRVGIRGEITGQAMPGK